MQEIFYKSLKIKNMETIKIYAPQDAEYITKKWFKEMPANAILNKGITGCGATEYVIRNNAPAIIPNGIILHFKSLNQLIMRHYTHPEYG